MKKTTGVIGGIVIVFIVAVILLMNMDFNRLGKENAYVQLNKEPRVEEETLESGEVMKRYWYELSAYNKEGKAIAVEFSSSRALREDAYLMLYLDDSNEVTSYDEVKESDIPSEVIEKINA